MIDIVPAPNWFYGYEIVIDIIGAIVLFLISYYSLKCYKLDDTNKRYAYLSAGFFLIGFAFLFKIIGSIIVYFFGVSSSAQNAIKVTQLVIWSESAPYTLSFLVYRFLMLFGLFVIFRLSEKKLGLSTQDNFFVLALLAVIVFFTQNLYYIFHAIALIALFMISYNYIKLYSANKSASTKMLGISFGIICVSHVIVFFSRLEYVLVVIGEILQLTAYIIMLATFVQVLNHGKKKK